MCSDFLGSFHSGGMTKRFGSFLGFQPSGAVPLVLVSLFVPQFVFDQFTLLPGKKLCADEYVRNALEPINLLTRLRVFADVPRTKTEANPGRAVSALCARLPPCGRRGGFPGKPTRVLSSPRCVFGRAKGVLGQPSSRATVNGPLVDAEQATDAPVPKSQPVGRLKAGGKTPQVAGRELMVPPTSPCC
jgi:hypothetical protein